MQVNKTVASSLLIVCCFSGELQILKINGRNRRIDLVHMLTLWNKQEVNSKQQPQGASKIQKETKSHLYGLSKLGDGRFVVLSNNGFTIWQVSGLNGNDIHNKILKLNQ